MSLVDERDEALRKIWTQSIDIRDKGILDIDEWTNAIRRLNCGLSDPNIRSLFNLIDVHKSGHIDLSDFTKTVSTKLADHSGFKTLIQSVLPSDTISTLNLSPPHNDDDHKEVSVRSKWHQIYIKHFGATSSVSEDVWTRTMSQLNIPSVSDDELRLFHAVMDSQFRSCFDFDEFHETFTVESLHHQQMDVLRHKLSSALAPNPRPIPKPISKPISKPIPRQKPSPKSRPKQKRETKEISIQTEMFNLRDHLRSLSMNRNVINVGTTTAITANAVTTNEAEDDEDLEMEIIDGSEDEKLDDEIENLEVCDFQKLFCF